MDDIAILESMENQYLIAEHYYNLTEYIDQNIYKFKRNGRYLQEGFGTVALWVAGIALAAGIGIWVYKTFFNKDKAKVKEQTAANSKAVAQKAETEMSNTAAAANQVIGDASDVKAETMENFIGSPFYNKCLDEIKKTLNETTTEGTQARVKMIEGIAPSFAERFGIDVTTAEQILGKDLTLDEIKKQKQFKAKNNPLAKISNILFNNPIFKFAMCAAGVLIAAAGVLTGGALVAGALVPLMPFGAWIPTAGFFATTILGALGIGVGINVYQKFKNELDAQYRTNETFQNSVKSALYLLNYFLAIQTILEQEISLLSQNNKSNQISSMASNKAINEGNFNSVYESIKKYVEDQLQKFDPNKNWSMPNINMSFYNSLNTNISKETLGVFQLTAIPTIKDITSLSAKMKDLDLSNPQNGDEITKFCYPLFQQARTSSESKKQVDLANTKGQSNPIVNPRDNQIIRSWSQQMTELSKKSQVLFWMDEQDVLVKVSYDLKAYNDNLNLIKIAANALKRNPDELAKIFLNVKYNRNINGSYEYIFKLKDKIGDNRISPFVNIVILNSENASTSFEEFLKQKNMNIQDFYNAKNLGDKFTEIKTLLNEYNSKLKAKSITEIDIFKNLNTTNLEADLKQFNLQSIDKSKYKGDALKYVEKFESLLTEYQKSREEKPYNPNTSPGDNTYMGSINKLINELNELIQKGSSYYNSTFIKDKTITFENFINTYYSQKMNISTGAPPTAMHFTTQFNNLCSRLDEFVRYIGDEFKKCWKENDTATKNALDVMTSSLTWSEMDLNNPTQIKNLLVATFNKSYNDIFASRVTNEETKAMANRIYNIIQGRDNNPSILKIAAPTPITPAASINQLTANSYLLALEDINNITSKEMAVEKLYKAINDSAQGDQYYIYKQVWNMSQKKQVDEQKPLDQLNISTGKVKGKAKTTTPLFNATGGSITFTTQQFDYIKSFWNKGFASLQKSLKAIGTGTTSIYNPSEYQAAITQINNYFSKFK